MMNPITLTDYNIYITHDKLIDFSKHIKAITSNKRLFVITDSNVYNLYNVELRNKLNDFELIFVIINGKNMFNYNKTINSLFMHGINKTDLLVSFGGGVVGDITGFIASTIFRGIKYIQIPTTLLAQIDSSVGGKTAIDTKFGKNLIGSFYNPKLVLIDTIFLETLNKREYNNGLAEAIKMALLFDNKLFISIKENEKISLDEIIKVINYKKKIVELDFFDNKERRLLNFGHTFGHAIEKTNNYKTYKHGEAISYGMLIALMIGKENGFNNETLYNELVELLISLNLIVKPITNYKKYLKIINFDKKITNEGIDFIILESIEKPKIIKLTV